MIKKLSIFTMALSLITLSCKEAETTSAENGANQNLDFEQEKKDILETLNNETKAAFQRDYEAWKEK